MLKSVEESPKCSPSGLEPMSHTSMALMVQYLNVRQRKLGTSIIQTVRMYSVDTDWLPMEDFFKHNPNCFQTTQPGGSTFPSCLAPFQIFTVDFQFCSPLFTDGCSISLLLTVWSSVSLHILVLQMYEILASYSFLRALLYIFCLVWLCFFWTFYLSIYSTFIYHILDYQCTYTASSIKILSLFVSTCLKCWFSLL